MAVSRGPSTRALPLIGVAILGLATAGCQSMAVAMDDSWAYDSGPAPNAVMNSHCSVQAQDAAIWGTLPSAWCTPYGPSLYWSRPAPGYPYIMGGERGAPGEGHLVTTRGDIRAGIGMGDSVPGDFVPAEAAAEP